VIHGPNHEYFNGKHLRILYSEVSLHRIPEDSLDPLGRKSRHQWKQHNCTACHPPWLSIGVNLAKLDVPKFAAPKSELPAALPAPAPVRVVKTGGFADPNGVPANTATNHGSVLSILTNGLDHGAGSGANGRGKFVASAGVGTGQASAPGSNGRASSAVLVSENMQPAKRPFSTWRSPYKDKLNQAGLYLKALSSEAERLPNLIKPLLGSQMGNWQQCDPHGRSDGACSPAADHPHRTACGLPLGARTTLDPWTGKLRMTKLRPVPLLSARQKMPFEITPISLHLRYESAADEKIAQQ
jgi:hypothetical protein